MAVFYDIFVVIKSIGLVYDEDVGQRLKGPAIWKGPAIEYPNQEEDEPYMLDARSYDETYDTAASALKLRTFNSQP